MYHSVGRVLSDWRWSNLTIPAPVFEDHLRALRRAGYRSASLARWHAHATAEAPLPPRTVVLTFDDGYVDNWCYAAPLLERYGFTGTVLVTPEFVPAGDLVRPTLRDVWEGRAREPDLPVRAFMSWEELRRVARSGVLDVQCHAMTHTWYPTRDEIVDFHHPGDPYYWLDWNADPAGKPYYLERLAQTVVPYGAPVYAHERSLSCRRFLPDPREADHLAAFVAGEGGAALFARPGWRDLLHRESARFRAAQQHVGQVERDEEYRARLEREIVESRRVIEANVGGPVDFLVWPAGGYNEDAVALARAHYRAMTVSSQERWRYRNRPGENPGSIVRRGVPSIGLRGRTLFFPGDYLVDFLDEFRGSSLARRRRQARKVFYLACARSGLWPRAS
jgi:peptidoglycan/xylan/chitin deacetylase (PgdA/CDA1 family)